MKWITIGVFPPKSSRNWLSKSKWHAYTMWGYNADWNDCIPITVLARNGKEAKSIAINMCMQNIDPQILEKK